MEYNTSRQKLVLPEYGRHIQKLIDYIKTIEDRDERTKAAEDLIPIMAQVNTSIKENGDFKHKLWDHLFIMADFELDIDTPFEIIKPEVLNRKPDPMPYTQASFKKKHYGRIIQDMIAKLDDYEGEEKEALTELLANQLKKSYIKWNKDSVNDDVIFNDFRHLAGTDVEIKDDLKLVETKAIMAKPKKRKTTRKNRN
ncbi:MAG: DUF4290 domain-containing protein [Salinivirgaceae bacterium]|jgi:hypothetical protein|nr:DUF4290 domain-containing protein [Salinivirgaceae bacterium]